MSVNFPTSLDSFTNPGSTDFEDTVPHATQHSNHNDAITALETKVGIDSSAVTTTLDYKLKSASSVDPGHLHTSAGISGQISIAKGGTNSATASTARTALGLAIGTNVEAWSANLDSWSGKTAPSGTAVGTSDTQTLTNKRVTRRVVATTQSATPTINTDNTDVSYITGLAQAITSMTTNLTGTPVNGDSLIISFTDDGTARAITWGTKFEASGTVALPTTTVISTRLDVGFLWNIATSKWRVVAVS